MWTNIGKIIKRKRRAWERGRAVRLVRSGFCCKLPLQLLFIADGKKRVGQQLDFSKLTQLYSVYRF